MLKRFVVMVILSLSFVFAQSLLGMQASQKQAAQEADRVEKSIQVLREIVELPKPEEALPGVLLNKAEGLAVFPGVIKAAYGIGGQYGRGDVTAREILYSETMKAPAVVEQLKAALAKYSGRKK